MKKLPHRRLPKRLRAWVRGRLRSRAWDAVPQGRRRLKWAGEQWALSEMNRLAYKCNVHVLFDSHAAESGNTIEVCGLWRARRENNTAPWQWWMRNLDTWAWQLCSAEEVRQHWPALHLWPFGGMRESTQVHELFKAASQRLITHALKRAQRRFTTLGVWEGDLAARIFKKRLRASVLQSKRAQPALRCLRRFVWKHMLDAPARGMLVAIHGRTPGFGIHHVCDLMLHLPVAQAWQQHRPNALPLLRSVPPSCWCEVEQVEEWLAVAALRDLIRTKLPPPKACEGNRPWNKAARARHQRSPLKSSPVPVCRSLPQLKKLLAAPYSMVEEAVVSGRHGGRYWNLPSPIRHRIDLLPVRERAWLVGVLAVPHLQKMPISAMAPVVSFYVEQRCAYRIESGSWGHRGSKQTLAQLALPLSDALEELHRQKWRPVASPDWSRALPSGHPWCPSLRAQALEQAWGPAPDAVKIPAKRF